MPNIPYRRPQDGFHAPTFPFIVDDRGRGAALPHGVDDAASKARSRQVFHQLFSHPPADFKGDVFERFVRATNQGTGYGLGLSIVREIVSRHRGTVTLQSVRPHGLAVVMAFPAAMDAT